MRLIDADVLINEIYDFPNEHMYIDDDGDVAMPDLPSWIHMVISDAPIVEAIPIEWLEREFSRRGIVTSRFRVMVGNEQLPDEVYVDARIVVRDIIDVWREEQKDETDKSRAFD